VMGELKGFAFFLKLAVIGYDVDSGHGGYPSM
jgi:hypothetical protein